MSERDFKGVWIPKEVWLDDNLTMLDKGILVEIDSLDMGEDGCWASNEYLAKFCQCSIPKVATSISKLVDLGYIRRESFDGRKRKLKSCLSFSTSQPYKNYKADLQKVDAINIKNNTKNKSISHKRADTEIPVGFTEFYNLYPKKVSKATAVKAWKKLNPDQALLNTILNDIRRRLEGVWKGKELQYIPNPSTYINQRRWEDEIATGNVEEEPVSVAFKDLPREEQQRLEEKFADEYWAARGK